MERIKNFFESNIFEFLPILLGIYIILYLLKLDLYIIITLLLFSIYFYYKYNYRNEEKNTIISNNKESKFQNKLPSLINNYDDIINYDYDWLHESILR
jgi:Ca2+/Na+ antiporter